MTVYFSASDGVLEWTRAFLESFRASNPDLRLILIPFNERCDQLRALAERYRFEIFECPTFSRLEAIGRALDAEGNKLGPYWFRRYAAFWGPAERFIYLDARQVVLSDLSEINKVLERFDFAFYDCAPDQVYGPGSVRTGFLEQGRGRGFNSGRWAARRGVFTIEDFERMAAEMLPVRDQLNRRNTDQFFINYCVDRMGVKAGHWAEVLGDLIDQGWVRQPGSLYREAGVWRLWDFGGLNHRKRVFLMHWAGFRLDVLCPRRPLLDRYRFAHLPTVQRIAKRGGSFAVHLFQSALYALRGNRRLNGLLHRLKRSVG